MSLEFRLSKLPACENSWGDYYLINSSGHDRFPKSWPLGSTIPLKHGKPDCHKIIHNLNQNLEPHASQPRVATLAKLCFNTIGIYHLKESDPPRTRLEKIVNFVVVPPEFSEPKAIHVEPEPLHPLLLHTVSSIEDGDQRSTKPLALPNINYVVPHRTGIDYVAPETVDEVVIQSEPFKIARSVKAKLEAISGN